MSAIENILSIPSVKAEHPNLSAEAAAELAKLRAENINLGVQVGDLDAYCTQLRAELDAKTIDNRNLQLSAIEALQTANNALTELAAKDAALDEARKIIDDYSGSDYRAVAWLSAHPAQDKEKE